MPPIDTTWSTASLKHYSFDEAVGLDAFYTAYLDRVTMDESLVFLHVYYNKLSDYFGTVRPLSTAQLKTLLKSIFAFECLWSRQGN